MNILEGCLKAVGTVALGATGLASKILEETSNAVGFNLGSELFSFTKEASLSGIRNMWDSDDPDSAATLDRFDKATQYVDESMRGAGNRMMADAALKAARIAKQHGDMEKYEHYMEQYNNYKN